ncbi:MAG TPA: hypothetical protein HPP97_15380 [Desulfuromonadales bacterium]|nr:hypothetical protein [Desulfuromonadales bacterium]
MKYLNEADGLNVVISLRDFNDLVDELRMLTMPPVLAGLERLDATDRFIAGQLAVPEQTVSEWKSGTVTLTAAQQARLCNMLERGLKIYEDILAGYDVDESERPFYERGVLEEHIRCAGKLLALQRDLIAADDLF